MYLSPYKPSFLPDYYNRRYRINEKTNAFWLVGALKRDNQFIVFTTLSFFSWDFLLSYPPSNTTMHHKKLKWDIVYLKGIKFCGYFQHK